MHEDEVRATPELVERLVAEQCPQWADLPVTTLPDDVEGTDNVLFRLGDELVVRMPKIDWAAGPGRVRRALAAAARPAPARGRAGAGPRRPALERLPVGVVRGALGRRVHAAPPRRRRRAARPGPRSLRPDPACGRRHGRPHQAAGIARHPARATPTTGARAGLERLRAHDDGIDLAAAERAWELCVSAPDWGGDPVWFHGDLQPGNLVVDDGRLVAVIDWGALGVGDPAPDVAAALWTFTGEARERLPRGGLPRRRHVAPRLRLGAGAVAHRHRLLPAHLPPDG